MKKKPVDIRCPRCRGARHWRTRNGRRECAICEEREPLEAPVPAPVATPMQMEMASKPPETAPGRVRKVPPPKYREIVGPRFLAAFRWIQ